MLAHLCGASCMAGAKRHEVELIIDKHQKLVDRHFGSARAQFIERLQKIRAFFVILRGCFERRVKIRISVGKAYLRQLIGGKAECAERSTAMSATS